ncbi:MAG: DUF3500 domain-containing protein [Betaproteobacteria bacterium]
MTRRSQIDLQDRTQLHFGPAGGAGVAISTDGLALPGPALKAPGLAMASAAQAFLASLEPQQQAQVSLPFDGEDRYRWHYFPEEMFARPGVNIEHMSDAQRKAAHALIRSALSTQGYLKATHIMQLEIVLGALERLQRSAGCRRDPVLYWLMLFGTPSRDKPWGWRVEGHHLSLTFIAVTPELVATTPAFMGANPAEVPAGQYAGLRILSAEEEIARALLASLDANQRERAIIASSAPQDIITSNCRRMMLQDPAGLAAEAMSEPQRAILWQLVEEYAHNMQSDLADRQLDKIERAGVGDIHFAWAGSQQRGTPHYYRLHGPTALIEYDNTNGNHIHTVFRDFTEDFGEDLLRRHYEASHK